MVGLDVSQASHGALAWAANQARSTGAELRAVHALLVPALMFASVGQMSVPTSLVGDDRVEQAYRDAVAAVWETVRPEPSWRLEFYNADPGRLLVAESRHAGLLVIGTREHVGWGRILNGSVSTTASATPPARSSPCHRYAPPPMRANLSNSLCRAGLTPDPSGSAAKAMGRLTQETQVSPSWAARREQSSRLICTAPQAD